MAAILLVGDDLTQYLWHRVSHTPLLWPLHRAHHSAHYMSIRITYRNNFFYYLMMPGLWISGVLIYLGFGTVYLVYIVVKLAVILGAHSAVRWDEPLYRIKALRAAGLARRAHGLDAGDALGAPRPDQRRRHRPLHRQLRQPAVLLGRALPHREDHAPLPGRGRPARRPARFGKERWFVEMFYPLLQSQPHALDAQPRAAAATPPKTAPRPLRPCAPTLHEREPRRQRRTDALAAHDASSAEACHCADQGLQGPCDASLFRFHRACFERRCAMKVFITGATGVIGRRAVPLLLKAGHEVSAAVRSADREAPLARLGARPIVVDLFDRPGLERALAGHDAVVNLATHMPGTMLRAFLPWSWHENDRLRRDASRILVDAALAGRVGRFVQESFAPVYPDRGEAWIGEEVPIAPTRYNRTVADAEASARRFAASDGGAGVVLRFAAFYGADAFQSLAMIDAVRKGFAPLPGPADAFYSSVSHDDAAAAVVAALALPTGAYNVADDEPLRRREMAALIAAGLGVAPPRPLPGWLVKLTGSLGELMSRSVRISNRKLRAASGWAPRWPSLREGWPAMLQSMPPGAGSAADRQGNALRGSR